MLIKPFVPAHVGFEVFIAEDVGVGGTAFTTTLMVAAGDTHPLTVCVTLIV